MVVTAKYDPSSSSRKLRWCISARRLTSYQRYPKSQRALLLTAFNVSSCSRLQSRARKSRSLKLRVSRKGTSAAYYASATLDIKLKLSSVRCSVSLSAFLATGDDRALLFEQLPFSHPLFILYTSGTTGPPKCIVHCAGVSL